MFQEGISTNIEALLASESSVLTSVNPRLFAFLISTHVNINNKQVCKIQCIHLCKQLVAWLELGTRGSSRKVQLTGWIKPVLVGLN